MTRDHDLHPFAALGLEPRFDLDMRRLRSAWVQRAAQSHPDSNGGLGESALINDALRVLSDPIERAGCLLRLFRAPISDERRLPQGFLEEMMELRERVDPLDGEPGDRCELVELARSRRQRAIEQLGAIFARVTDGRIDSEGAQDACIQMNVIRAFDRMIEQLAREVQS